MIASLPARLVEKPWGRSILPFPFTAPTRTNIGEVWFEPPAELDSILVKYIFTSEKLSVQVHPSDAQTMMDGLGRRGKDECWLVLDADPDAQLGIGFNNSLDMQILQQAALDGSIEKLLTWHAVKAGDFFYIPANTVHAIGAGITLVEVQQNSDITYRLYDYGRPRELQLERATAIADKAPYDEHYHYSVPASGEIMLTDGPFFRILRYHGPLSDKSLKAFDPCAMLALPFDGDIAIGLEKAPSGLCTVVSSIENLNISSGALGLLIQPVGH